MFQNVLPSDDDLRLTTHCKIFTPAWANLGIQRPRGGQTSHQRKSKHRDTLTKCSQQSLNLCFTSFNIVLRRGNTAAIYLLWILNLCSSTSMQQSWEKSVWKNKLQKPDGKNLKGSFGNNFFWIKIISTIKCDMWKDKKSNVKENLQQFLSTHVKVHKRKNQLRL